MKNKSRSYFDLSDKEKQEIMDKAAKESSEAQQDLIAKANSVANLKTDLKTEYKI